MKKFVIFVSAFVCILCLVSCSGKSDDAGIINIREISGLVTEDGYTEDDFQEELFGQYREDIIGVWGEPDGMLSGFWGDIWHLSDESNKQMIIYYDKDGMVEDIRIAERYK